MKTRAERSLNLRCSNSIFPTTYKVFDHQFVNAINTPWDVRGRETGRGRYLLEDLSFDGEMWAGGGCRAKDNSRAALRAQGEAGLQAGSTAGQAAHSTCRRGSGDAGRYWDSSRRTLRPTSCKQVWRCEKGQEGLGMKSCGTGKYEKPLGKVGRWKRLLAEEPGVKR